MRILQDERHRTVKHRALDTCSGNSGLYHKPPETENEGERTKESRMHCNKQIEISSGNSPPLDGALETKITNIHSKWWSVSRIQLDSVRMLN